MKKCASCQTESDGRFCPECGAPFAGASCASCKAKLVAGARFCTQCGKPVRTTATAGRHLPWMIAGAAILVAALAILIPTLRSDSTTSTGAPFTGQTATGSPPPLTGTPREQADRLFNRIMQEREAGNIDQARFFAPMAIQAYQASEPLDADGFYHLSLIHIVAGDFAAARRTAEQILAQDPSHLLALAAIAEAGAAAGDVEAARSAWQRYLDAYESERTRQKPEYLDHAGMLARYAEDAKAAVTR